MKNKSIFIPSAAAILVLMLILPLPALVLEVLIWLELAFAIGILAYSFTKNNRVMPQLVLYFCLFSLAISVGLTRFALLGFEKGDQIPLIQLLGRNMYGIPNMVFSFIIAIILLTVTVLVNSKVSKRISEVTNKSILIDNMSTKRLDIVNKLSCKELSEEEADRLIEKVIDDVDFYSNMDSDSKFLCGIVKVNIVIAVITLIGGFLIQNLVCKTGVKSALESVSIIVAGNMIVSTIPLLIVSNAIDNVFSKTEVEKFLQMSKSARSEDEEALKE